jgi:hypothetical protein
MLHTVEDLIERIELMKNKAIQLHRLRNQYSEISGKTYDKTVCNELLTDIQSIARLISLDTEGDEIKTRMEYKDEKF